MSKQCQTSRCQSWEMLEGLRQLVDSSVAFWQTQAIRPAAASPWPQAACLRVSSRGLGVFNIASSPGRWQASSFMNFNAPPLILTHRLDWKSPALTHALAAAERRPNKTGTREHGSFGAVEKSEESAQLFIGHWDGEGWATGWEEEMCLPAWLCRRFSSRFCQGLQLGGCTLHFLLTPNVDVVRLHFSKSSVPAVTRWSFNCTA